MADSFILPLTLLTGNQLASGDSWPVEDASDLSETKRLSWGELLVGLGTVFQPLDADLTAIAALSPGAAGGYVRSNGSAWARGLIQTGDLPDLSATYQLVSGLGSAAFASTAAFAAAVHTHAAADVVSGQLALARGGTGLDTSGVTNGQLLIGATSGHTLALATITAGSGITVTNAANSITIAATGGGGGTPGGSDTQVQFNDAAAFGGDAELTYNKTTNTLTVGTSPGVSVSCDGTTGTIDVIGSGKALRLQGGSAHWGATFSSAVGMAFGTDTTNYMSVATTGAALRSTSQFMWSNTADATGTVDVGLARSAAGVVKATDGASNKKYFEMMTGAGAPTDSVPDGCLYVDTTNSKIYARVGGAWKSVTVA